MMIKRILFLLTIMLTSFTLAACNVSNNEPEIYAITVTSNIEGVTPIYFESSTIGDLQSYVFTTYDVDGYTFEYWHIEGNTEELSSQLSFVYAPTGDSTVEAYYSNNSGSTDDYTITVTSNVPSINVTFNETKIGDDTRYQLIAPVTDDYTFLYWVDVNTDAVLSSELTFTFIASKDQSIEAVYEMFVIPEPTLFYDTSFDDVVKIGYSEGRITTFGKEWTLSDALVGNHSSDLNVEGSSIRIRNGYIQTEFTVTDLAQVRFYAGTYGSDDDTTVTFLISTDKSTWITVDSFTSTGTLELYNYIFNDTLISSLGIDTDNAYYLRIESIGSPRTNVDDFQIYTGEGYITEDTSLYTISFNNMAIQYLLNDTVDVTGCIATHTTTGATTCDVSGLVDSSVAGVYEIIFSKTDEFGNTAVEIVRITVIDPVNVDINMDLMAYYDDAEGLYGDALIAALHTILNNGFTGVTYGAARYILDDSDADPSNSSNVILVYYGTSVSGVWDCSPCTWNREHVWPQSLLGSSANNSVVNAASDLFNLMPANPSENSSRGNKPYSALGLGYEPRDEVKGDVARALFYMMMMYDNLELVNTAPGTHEMGYLDELLAWHIADPVSQFELNRLEVIAAEQNNRNPFVDYPHLVDLIWFYTAE